jgi:hypothetical protein
VLCEDSGGEEVVFVSQTSVLDFCKSSLGTCGSPLLLLVLLDIGYDDDYYSDDMPAVQVQVPSPYIVVCLSDLIFFVNFSYTGSAQKMYTHVNERKLYVVL